MLLHPLPGWTTEGARCHESTTQHAEAPVNLSTPCDNVRTRRRCVCIMTTYTLHTRPSIDLVCDVMSFFHVGLYKGLLPNIFKLAPAAGIGWYVFEESKRALGLDPRI